MFLSGPLVPPFGRPPHIELTGNPQVVIVAGCGWRLCGALGTRLGCDPAFGLAQPGLYPTTTDSLMHLRFDLHI